jgi:hypothetical protein
MFHLLAAQPCTIEEQSSVIHCPLVLLLRPCEQKCSVTYSMSQTIRFERVDLVQTIVLDVAIRFNDMTMNPFSSWVH